MLVECATDNRNRSVSEVRAVFSKHGGNLGTDGSVAYLFEKIGSLVFAAGADEERILEIALQAGADDVDSEDGVVEVVTSPGSFLQVERALRDSGLAPEMSELIQRATQHAELRGEKAEQAVKLIDALEQLEDVQNVFTNAAFAA